MDSLFESLPDMDKVHGFLRDPSWDPPFIVHEDSRSARPGFSSMSRNEYNDTPEILRAKILILAGLLLKSQNAIVYTGAGISTASGIDDYASNADKSTIKFDRPHLKTHWHALPTFSHYALVSLHQQKLIKYWIQQNHDGLPQKAGYPQHMLNEIHGAWYDPSNPVVQMSGHLREDLFQDVKKWEEQTDLCLALGTSLAGMSCDCVVTTVGNNAKRSFFKETTSEKSNKIGAVIIGLQQTQHDSLCCLRIFAKLDDAMESLLNTLQITPTVARELVPVVYQTPVFPIANQSLLHFGLLEADVFWIPYDQKTGQCLNKRGDPASNTEEYSDCEDRSLSVVDSAAFSILDLRDGSKVELTMGPHKGAVGEVMGKNFEGHYKITFRVTEKKFPLCSVLGLWWLQAAIEGTVTAIPVVNCVENSEACSFWS